MRTILTVLFLILGIRNLAAQEASVLRPHALGALQTAMNMTGPHLVHMSFPLKSSMVGPSGETYQRQALGEDVERQDPLSPEGWVELVSRHLGRGLMDEGAVTMTLQGNVLWVEAPESVHEEVSALVAAVQGQFLRAVDVRLHVLPARAAEDAGTAVLSRSALTRLLERAPPVASSMTNIRVGQLARLVAARRQAFLRDYDVEVAQESQIADPLVSALLEGPEFNVRVLGAPAGRHFVRIAGRHCVQDGEPRTVLPGSTFVGEIQLPRGFSTLLTTSAIVEDGGGVLVGHTGHPGTLWLWEIKSSPATTRTAGARDVIFIPVGDLTEPAHSFAAPLVISPISSGVGAGVGDDQNRMSPENSAPVTEDFLIGHFLTRESLPAGGLEEAHMQLMGGDLFVKGPEALRNRVTETVARWSQELSRTVNLEVRVGRIESDRMKLLLLRDTPAGEIAALLQTTAVGAGRAGDTILLAGGREEVYVKDHDVEIAQAGVISDPIIDALFDGFVFSFVASPMPEGRIHVGAEYTYQASVAGMGSFKTGLAEVGSIDVPATAHVTGRASLILENGKWALLRAAPLTGTNESFVAVVRAGL